MERSFRINEVIGPESIGFLNLQYHYRINFEYDPGKASKTREGKVNVYLSDKQAYAIAEGPIEKDEPKEVATSRIVWLVTQCTSSEFPGQAAHQTYGDFQAWNYVEL